MKTEKNKFKSEVSESELYCRFICSTILHLSLLGEVADGMNNMKYAVNHSYKFTSLFMSFLPGFMQASAVIWVEIVNLLVILC